jgi:wyosine [tRNA(Phe)-imidazoG37] synthetase (radical SAM superfamily)
MQEQVPEPYRQLQDIAISGNGEPTSCRDFDQIIEDIQEVMGDFGLLDVLPLRLITNGSYVMKPSVQKGLRKLHRHVGEVWIKVDRVTEQGIREINGVSMTRQRLLEQIRGAAKLAPTWIQSCMFMLHGQTPPPDELEAYLEFLAELKREGIDIQGVLLYGLARPSMQDGAQELAPLSGDWMNWMADRIRQLDMLVKVFP